MIIPSAGDGAQAAREISADDGTVVIIRASR